MILLLGVRPNLVPPKQFAKFARDPGAIVTWFDFTIWQHCVFECKGKNEGPLHLGLFHLAFVL